MDWKVTWLGHSSFRIETGGRVLMLDPWLKGNPSFDESRFDEAVAGATDILVSHGHFDHTASVVEVAQKTGAKLSAQFEIAEYFGAQGAGEATPFHKGGTVDLGGVRVTLVDAVHSSSLMVDGKPLYLGAPAGLMIESGQGADAETLYFMGDTDVFSDMGLYQELHRPKYGIVPMGGHFTMDAKRAAFACKKFFQFEAVIPCHYRTFPLLAQSADEFVAEMAPTTVIAPAAMETVSF